MYQYLTGGLVFAAGLYFYKLRSQTPEPPISGPKTLDDLIEQSIEDANSEDFQRYLDMALQKREGDAPLRIGENLPVQKALAQYISDIVDDQPEDYFGQPDHHFTRDEEAYPRFLVKVRTLTAMFCLLYSDGRYVNIFGDDHDANRSALKILSNIDDFSINSAIERACKAVISSMDRYDKYREGKRAKMS